MATLTTPPTIESINIPVRYVRKIVNANQKAGNPFAEPMPHIVMQLLQDNRTSTQQEES